MSFTPASEKALEDALFNLGATSFSLFTKFSSLMQTSPNPDEFMVYLNLYLLALKHREYNKELLKGVQETIYFAQDVLDVIIPGLHATNAAADWNSLLDDVILTSAKKKVQSALMTRIYGQISNQCTGLLSFITTLAADSDKTTTSNISAASTQITALKALQQKQIDLYSADVSAGASVTCYEAILGILSSSFLFVGTPGLTPAPIINAAIWGPAGQAVSKVVLDAVKADLDNLQITMNQLDAANKHLISLQDQSARLKDFIKHIPPISTDINNIKPVIGGEDFWGAVGISFTNLKSLYASGASTAATLTDMFAMWTWLLSTLMKFYGKYSADPGIVYPKPSEEL